jgi:hypothetical protein
MKVKVSVKISEGIERVTSIKRWNQAYLTGSLLSLFHLLTYLQVTWEEDGKYGILMIKN